jgi:hypothetical protein
MNLRIPVIFLLGCGLLSAAPSQRVGMPLEIQEVYIPGGNVKPKPRRDRKPALVVRILDTRPAKDGHRYDFEVQGLEPGQHNLADYLDAPEGTTIPAIPLEITSTLEPGLVRPHPIGDGPLPELGGYQTTMVILGAAWLAGLGAILIWRRKKAAPETSDTAAPLTLAERLRPLIDEAAKGNLTSDGRAKLERLVIGHWRERLPDIANLSPAEAMMKLRTDPQAAPLILALERWLHARDSHTPAADIERLLAPYQ